MDGAEEDPGVEKGGPSDAEVARRALEAPLPAEVILWDRGLSSSSTMLNLAMTGRPDVGYLPGYYYFFVGDSNSGKSFLTLASMAEASICPAYDDYRFIYDGGEYGALMDMGKFYGKKMVRRLEPPCRVDGKDRNSTTVEEFYYFLEEALDGDRPVIYVLDSMDVLSSSDEIKKAEEGKKAFRKKKEGAEEKVSGSYGDGKAKKNSSSLRRIIPRLKETGSILIIINQTRDNIGAGPFSFEKKTRSGGHALEFYACVQMWSSKGEKIKKRVREKDRHVGNHCRIKVKRSRFTGRDAVVDVPILFSSGVDDVGSCVDYLLEEGHWSKSGGLVSAPEFDFKGHQEKLVEHVESSDQEGKLRALVYEVWDEIATACQLKRKNRYE